MSAANPLGLAGIRLTITFLWASFYIFDTRPTDKDQPRLWQAGSTFNVFGLARQNHHN
jgi:hypothetical protein